MGKTDKIIYWIATIILTTLMLFSAGFYLIATPMVVEFYTLFGYPAYLIYLNATAKILGSVVILTRKFDRLKEWVYAGFTYIFVLGIIAHMTTDGAFMGAAVGLIALIVSYVYDKKITRKR